MNFHYKQENPDAYRISASIPTQIKANFTSSIENPFTNQSSGNFEIFLGNFQCNFYLKIVRKIRLDPLRFQ